MLVSVCSKGSLKNDNSVINYSPSCCSIPLFICKTQTKIFLIKSRAFWPSIESKAQKHRKDIVKIVCVTSMVQLWFCEATRILFVRKENKNNYLIQQFLLFHVSLNHAFTTHVVCKGFWCRASANHKLLGALRRTGGGGLGGWRVWLRWKNGCNLCFTPSRIAVAESAHLFHGSVCFRLFFSRARDCTIFTLHNLTDLYVERVTAHRFKINDLSCFYFSGQMLKQN